MREILLTQGKCALVDDSDYEWLSQWKWHAIKGHKTYYAVRAEQKLRQRTTIYMHRQLLQLNSGQEQSDHRNGNGLDNQRHNLRKASHSQNQRNKGISKNNVSGFKGVAMDRGSGKWQAHIHADGRQFNLGRFTSKEDAAAAYEVAAIKHHGEFAKLR